MSNFPNSLDTDVELPIVNDNIVEIGGDAINALRDAIFAIEQNIGFGVGSASAAGSTSSLTTRLGISINPDGTIKASALTGLGLVTLPITNVQISATAAIAESKLSLDHKTQDLFNLITGLTGDVNDALGWIAISGVKLEPHLIGAIYRHTLDQIDVTNDPIGRPFLKNKFRQFRDNLQSYNVVNDINNELLSHQWADGTLFGTIAPVATNSGLTYPSNYGHTASGIFLNTSRFTTVPQTSSDLQVFADFVDQSGILLLGTRIQNLYSNGISKISRSSSLSADGYGQPIVPTTSVISYLLNTGGSSIPFDDIDTGDDIIEFKPVTALMTSNSFDEQFALVKVGDIIRINYGNIEVPFVIKEKKYIQNGLTKKYIVRIAGKNLFYSPTAVARIDRPLVNNNKYGVLAVAPANNHFSQIPSLIVGSPRGAQALGIGFSPDEINETHYLLYLALYPTGFPQDGYTILPGIDITGNRGFTPGLYTLDSIVEATNTSLRKEGFNYRFIAFSYQGEFGIMLADSYKNAAFSVMSAAVTPTGAYDQLETNIVFQNNVVDLFPTAGHAAAPDPLGFGPFGANIASPPFMTAYGSAEASQIPTRLFVPLTRNNYYTNGAELERLNLQVNQIQDGYGDGYWVAEIISRTPSSGRVETKYHIPFNLSTSGLKVGKTLVIQSLGQGSLVDFGRFIIKDVNFNIDIDDVDSFTEITVWDAVHASGFSPAASLGVDGYVALYFNSDSVSFNAETATDFASISPFKRHFEVYIDQNSNTFTHERGRIGISGSNLIIDAPFSVPLYGSTELSKLDIIKISPKLRGYQFGPVNKISLRVSSYDSSTGLYDGYLASYDGSNFTHIGPTVIGKKGEVTRFYDETNIDYIDVLFDISILVNPFASFNVIDFQLFPTLSLDEEIMMIATCQVNDTTKFVNRVRDERQFGNVSEKEFSTSALNFLALPERLLHFNGVVRGFDIVDITNEFVTLTGGQALVNGKFQSINNQIFTIPRVRETLFSVEYPINWALCVNSIGELVSVPLTDFDATVGTPNSPNRIFTLHNVVSNTAYVIDSTSFVNLLNNRKDLTILHVVTSTITGFGPTATAALTSKDVRRFVNDQDSCIPAVIADGNSQGNFRIFSTAINWLRYNNHFQNTLAVKGSFTVSSDPLLVGISLNIFAQGANASLTFNSTLTLSTINFSDLTLVFNAASTINNSTFTNCIITFTGFVTTNNVRFINCTVVFAAGGSLTNTVIDPSIVTIGGLISATSTTITDSTIQVNVPQAFTLGSSFRFERNIATYAGVPGVGYDATNLVNDGYGMMYSNVTATLTDLVIRDNTFNTALTNRLSFISLQLTNYSSIVENVDISKNKFISTAAAPDLRAVISVVSTLTDPAGGGVYPKFPRLVNAFIENNMCNSDQMILLSTHRLPSTAITGAMLVTVNANISNNVCGAIGFITASAEAGFTNDIVPNNGLIRDKSDQLIINGNSCKLIANLDFRGDYISFRSTSLPVNNTDYVTVGTGAYSITNNAVNWIQVGCSSYTSPSNGAIIANNRVSPNNLSYLSNYSDTLVSGVVPGNVGILLRRERDATGTAHSLISGNIIAQKPLGNANGTYTTYYYDCAIACFNNAQVVNNSVIGVINSLTSPISFLWSTGNIVFTGNDFNRAGLDTQSYVTGQVGATNLVTITDNIFDGYTVDAANTNENVGFNIPNVWTFEKNKNQTGYMVLSLMDNIPGYGSGGGSAATTTAASVFSLNNIDALDIVHDDFSRFKISRAMGGGSAFDADITTAIGLSGGSYLQQQDDVTSGTPGPDIRTFSKVISLNNNLPDNVNVIEAKLGIWKDPTSLGLNTASQNNNQFILRLINYNDANTSNSPDGILDIKNNLDFINIIDASENYLYISYLQITPAPSTGSGVLPQMTYLFNTITDATFMGSTQYVTITPTNGLFVNKKSNRMAISYEAYYLRAAGGTGSVIIYTSPIKIKYRW